MTKHLIPAFALLALSGCAFQTQAQLNAELARHVGQSETDLVREMGVPTRHFDTGGHRFLAYAKGYQQITGFPGDGFGFGYGGWGGPWGTWGGGYGYGFGGGFGGPAEVVSYGCETTFEIDSGRVTGVKRHGNDC